MQPNFVIQNSADLSLSNCQSTDLRLRVIVIAILLFAGIIAGSGYHCVQDQTQRSCILIAISGYVSQLGLCTLASREQKI